MANIINKFDKNKSKKPIQLIKFLSAKTSEFEYSSNNADYYDNIELIRPASTPNSFDVIKCWRKEDGEHKCLIYLGHWNDGII